jgi:hypothetical protein
MSIWFCRECKRAFHQEHMLPGWNGLWCPNCLWNEVVPAQALAVAGAPASATPGGADAALPAERP